MCDIFGPLNYSDAGLSLFSFFLILNISKTYKKINFSSCYTLEMRITWKKRKRKVHASLKEYFREEFQIERIDQKTQNKCKNIVAFIIYKYTVYKKFQCIKNLASPLTALWSAPGPFGTKSYLILTSISLLFLLSGAQISVPFKTSPTSASKSLSK